MSTQPSTSEKIIDTKPAWNFEISLVQPTDNSQHHLVRIEFQVPFDNMPQPQTQVQAELIAANFVRKLEASGFKPDPKTSSYNVGSYGNDDYGHRVEISIRLDRTDQNQTLAKLHQAFQEIMTNYGGLLSTPHQQARGAFEQKAREILKNVSTDPEIVSMYALELATAAGEIFEMRQPQTVRVHNPAGDTERLISAITLKTGADKTAATLAAKEIMDRFDLTPKQQKQERVATR